MGGYFSKSEEAPASDAIAETPSSAPLGTSSGTVGGKKRRSKTRRGGKKGGRRHKTGKTKTA